MLNPKVSEASIMQVPEPVDFMVGLLVPTCNQWLILVLVPRTLLTRSRHLGKGRQASCLGEFHTACLEV